MDGLKDIRIGISSCLLGEQVRCDGGHRRNDSLVNIPKRRASGLIDRMPAFFERVLRGDQLTTSKSASTAFPFPDFGSCASGPGCGPAWGPASGPPWLEACL